jgi:hypothetical protein
LPKRKAVLNWKDIISILGALASISGLIILALHEEYRQTFVIITLAVLFFISSSFFISRIVFTLFKFYQDLRTVLEAKEVDIFGLTHIKKKWHDAIKEQNQYRLQSAHVGVRYHSKDGKRVTLFKDQIIIALEPGVSQIADTDLRTDGEFDWNTFKSTPGIPQITQRKCVASVNEIVTIFDKPLPMNKPFHREMSVDQVNSYTKQIEDLGLWITIPTQTACMSVEVPDDIELLDPIGIVTFGRCKMHASTKPEKEKKNKVMWIIQNPQIGEKYILTWRVN